MEKLIIRQKNLIIVSNNTEGSFEEAYNKVILSEIAAKRLNIQNGSYSKVSPVYKILEDHIKNVNRYCDPYRIPNKKVVTDVEGTSALIYKGDKIEIARRLKKGTENSTKTPSKCFISNDVRNKFFKVVKDHGHIVKGQFADRYYLSITDEPYFSLWHKSMLREYKRLSGIDPDLKRESTIKRDGSEDLLSIAKAIKNLNNFSSLFKDFIKEGHIIIDGDGRFLQYLEDPIEVLTIYRILQFVSDKKLRELTAIL